MFLKPPFSNRLRPTSLMMSTLLIVHRHDSPFRGSLVRCAIFNPVLASSMPKEAGNTCVACYRMSSKRHRTYAMCRRHVEANERMLNTQTSDFPSRLSHFNFLPQTSPVKVTNQTIGPAMSRLNNTMQSIFYLHVPESKPSFQPQRQKEGDYAANYSESKPDGPWVNRLDFVEDFLLEHSAPGTWITSIQISGIF